MKPPLIDPVVYAVDAVSGFSKLQLISTLSSFEFGSLVKLGSFALGGITIGAYV